jgi:hypothetical protein
MRFFMLRSLDNPSIAWKVLWLFIIAMLALAVARGMMRDSRDMEVSSFFILLVTASIVWRIFLVRRPPGTSALGSPARIWLFISLGFAYLALDEALDFHEGIDFGVHWLLGMTETGLTDRLDDMIILVYGVAGLIIIFRHRNEFRSFGDGRILFIGGFAFLVLMVAVDAGSNRPDLLEASGLDPRAAHRVLRVMEFLEEFLKLPAECAFLVAFARIYERASEPFRAARRAAAGGAAPTGDRAGHPVG